ncbi:DUF2207 domain-containing protein [Bifidobacterium sp. MA2]|uniref:DUF2207 domain-containing protein n=1 Tax=Bifidobacterium santillanense TaxID=2809028 RepID=A0ABS5URE0_9BIFI|nr:DUF2207 domain-containing protein [Bifidobacterium santillanense]MBT1173462.1 DUF2207 domain-containing protein [Bifidobacterium santillanense]
MSRKRIVRAVIVTVIVALLTLIGVLPMGLAAGGVPADASYRSIDYEATATPDGDLKVTQSIDYRLKRREDDDGNVKPYRQLYWQYTLNPGNLTNITDIRVRNLDTGRAYTRTEPRNPDGVGDTSWNSDYANHWYIADVTLSDTDPQPYDPASGGLSVGTGDPSGYSDTRTVELGWNIPVTTSADSMRFEVSYVMHDVATKYDDVTTFMWEPIGTTNQLPAGSVAGVVRFPDGVKERDVRTWLHSESNGEIARTSDGAIRFSLNDVKVGRYVDVVAAYDSAYAGDVARTGAGDRLPSLTATETAKEQAWADSRRTAARITLAVWIITTLLGALFAAWAIIAVIRSNKAARYTGGIEYWRDEPGVSPDSAARLIGVVDDSVRGGLNDRSLASTVLSLAVKKAIAIYPGSADLYRGIDMSRADPVGIARMVGADAGRLADAKSTNTIVILPAALAHGEDSGSLAGREARAALGLSQSESACLDLLIAISRRVGGPVFDFRRMRMACKDWRDGYEWIGRFRTAASNEFALLGATRRRGASYGVPAGLAIATGLLALVFNSVIGNLALMVCVGLPIYAVGLFCSAAGAPVAPTPAGQEYLGRCLGLKRYMEDFSDFADRGVPDLALWDWYMVYAAAFGISREAVAQLARAYPQVADPEWLDSHGPGTLWYWTYRPYAYGRYSSSDYGTSSALGASAGAGAAGGGPTPGDLPFGGDTFAAGFGDIGSQISAGFASVSSTISAAAPSSSSSGGGGSFGGGGGSFGGGGGGSGGGGGGAR